MFDMFIGKINSDDDIATTNLTTIKSSDELSQPTIVIIMSYTPKI